MSASSPMKPLFKLGRFSFYWAERRWFTRPGVHVWTGKRHVRILPFRRIRQKWCRAISPEGERCIRERGHDRDPDVRLSVHYGKSGTGHAWGGS